METAQIRLLLDSFKRISDDDILKALKNHKLSIADEKYHTAFSCVGIAGKLLQLPLETLREPGRAIPDPYMEGIRRTAALVFIAYTTLVYMRSKHLEDGLDNVGADSALAIYKSYFRAVASKKGDKGQPRPIAQHIRNALCHGTFETSSDLSQISFQDPDSAWSATFRTHEFEQLCSEIYRFYFLAFEASGNPGVHGLPGQARQ